MSPAPKNTKNDDTNEPTGAFGKDKLYGNRLDQAFAIGEHFVMLAARISDDVIETELGPANPARIVVQKVNDNDEGTGRPFVVTTLASAIVEKVKAIEDGELPALVELREVDSRFKRNGVPTKALVIQYVGAGDSVDEIAQEFGLDANELSKRVDAHSDAPLPAGY